MLSIPGKIKNLVQNPGFEAGTTEGLYYWTKHAQDVKPSAIEFQWDHHKKHSGEKSVCIINKTPNYAAYKQPIRVEPNCCYKLSCWIKTEGVGLDGKGADLLIDGVVRNNEGDLRGTNPWKLVTLKIKTGGNSEFLMVSLELGSLKSPNTGKVWFDNVTLEKFMILPYTPLKVQALTGGGLLVFAALFLLVASFAFIKMFPQESISLENQSDHRNSHLYFLLGAGFLLRVVIAPIFEGHFNDLSYFSSWAIAAAKGFHNFYIDNEVLHYPPLYIYILSLIGKLMGGGRWLDIILLKLPSIFADLGTAWLLFHFSKRYMSRKMGLLVAGFYLFNPAVWLNSTIWGQIDSLLTIFILAALIMLVNGRIVVSAVLFAAAVLLKPQGIIFLPLLLFELIRKKSLRDFVLAFLCSIAVTAMLVLPFSGDPLWLFKKFLTTAAYYPYASLNAFNLFALLGGNMTVDSTVLCGFSYQTWGTIFLVLLVLLCAFLYFKGRTEDAAFVVALLLITGVFVLSVRMHERYLFPALALSLFVFIRHQSLKTMLLHFLFVITVFINNYTVLFVDETTQGGLFTVSLFLVSLANVILFGYIIKVAFDIIIKKGSCKSSEEKTTKQAFS